MKKRKFKFKKIFTNFLTSYIVLLIVPIIFMFFLYNDTVKLNTRSTIDTKMDMLIQSSNEFDSLISQLDDISIELNDSYNVKSLVYIDSPKAGDEHVYDFYSFKRWLTNKLSFLHKNLDYYVMFKKSQSIFTYSSISYGFEFNFNSSRKYKKTSYKEWYDESFKTSSRNFIELQEIEFDNYNEKCITYNYPLKSAYNNTIGAIQFIINNKYLNRVFGGIVDDNNGSVYILNEDKSLIGQIGTNNYQYINFNKVNNNNGHYYTKINGIKNIAIYSKSSSKELIYLITIPEHVLLKDVNKIKYWSFFAILTCIFLELLFAYYLAKKYATPLRNIVVNLKNIFKEEEVSDYEYLENGVSNLLDTRVNMVNSLQKEEEKFRRYFLEMILEGKYKSEEEIYKIANINKINLLFTYYVVVCIKTKDAANLNTIVEKYEDEFFYYEIDEENLILLICSNKSINYFQEYLINKLEEINNTNFRKNGECLKIGVGNIYKDIANAFFSKKQAIYSARYSLSTTTEITRYEKVSTEVHYIYYPPEIEIKLIHYTKYYDIGNIEKIFTIVKEENIIKRKLSRDFENILFSNIEATLFKVYGEVTADVNMDSLIQRFYKVSDFSEKINLIENEFIKIATYINDKRPNNEDEFINNCKEYIKEHYENPQLCVALIAEHFKLSESYFSRSFKNKMEIPFSNYLEVIRMEKAKILIIESNESIENIATKVGYNSSSSFRRAFKRVVGLSPSKYKIEEDGKSIMPMNK
ncbi:MAG: helix-turn-helix domain-containing protein [Lachnospirales bacterium]